MSEENKEEVIDDGSSFMEELPAEAVAAPEQPETQNPKPETQDMEVHHHTHAGHGKKTWKSYFWEFLMLFLAVFCGFLAEYKLEQTIEHHREKEFIVSIVEDIKTDIVQADIRLKDYQNLFLIQDTLMAELSGDNIKTNSNRAYGLWRHSYGFDDFVYNDRTIQQLKNSGALRLIRKDDAAGSIMKYDQAVRNVQGVQLIMNNMLAGDQVYHRMFDFIKLKQHFKLNIPVPLTEQGLKTLNEAYSNREYWKDALGFLILQIKILTEEGRRALGTIKKEYNVE